MGAKEKGTRLKDGVLTYSSGHYLAGQPIPVDFDIYGYNYQGHIFEGSYANAYLGRDGFPPYPYEGTEQDKADYVLANPTVVGHWTWPYRDVYLQMKWNDAWLANTDRDGDGKLDRFYGFTSYIGSGAWLTNHQSGGIEEDGTEWTYFVKIVAAPADAEAVDGTWYAADGTEIGLVIWGAFAIIQEVEGGLQYGSPAGPGLGNL